MRQALFTIFLFCMVGLMACRKNSNEQTIKQFDQSQIQGYISANGITGMTTDPTDTTGTYYKIINPGAGARLDYPDKILIVFSVQSFDSKFVVTDTISNHVYDYLGHMTNHNLPYGLELALINILKYRGAKARLLIPSHMAYGATGFGSGSSTAGNRIAGNQCLDYTISVIDNSKQAAYDDLSIKNFIAANNLTGFTKTASGLYYKVVLAGTGVNAVGLNSTVTVQYTAKLLNGVMFDGYNTADGTGTTFAISDVIPGWQEGLTYGTDGAKISLIVPSALGYGSTTGSGATIFPYSVLYFDINLLTVTN